jgi:hypothetical protein
MELSVADGPSLLPNDHFDAEAYGKIEADIPEGSVATTVNVQPSLLTELQAILITAERYEDLTFTVDEGVVPITLSGPLLLIGPGNIGLLGASVLDLVFTNADTEEPNMVTILVARTAIEPIGN